MAIAALIDIAFSNIARAMRISVASRAKPGGHYPVDASVNYCRFGDDVTLFAMRPACRADVW